MYATEFTIWHEDVGDIIFMYLVLPFGFTGSPDILGRIMGEVGRYRHQRRPSNPLQNGVAPSKNKIFAGDGMFLAPKIGNIATQSVECGADGARLCLRDTAFSAKKFEADGRWAANFLLSGYYVDLDSTTIALPDPKLIASYNVIHLPVFDNGDISVDIHSMEELRGCMNNWLLTGRIRKRLVEHVNGLLGFADNTLVWIRGGGIRRLYAFLNVVRFLRDMTKGPDSWMSRFPGAFSEFVGLPRELARRQENRKWVWFFRGYYVLRLIVLAESTGEDVSIWLLTPTGFYANSCMHVEKPHISMRVSSSLRY